MYINFYFLSFLVIICLCYFPSILWSDSNEDNEEENDDGYSSKNETTEVQGGPEKTAQTLMRYNFSTAGHRVTRFPSKCLETNW